MAGFFDKVVEGINRGVSTVSEGSKTLVEKANLNTQIKDIEKDKSRMLQNLGTLVYNLHVRGEASIEQCTGMYNEVVAMDQRLVALQQQLQAIEMAKTQPMQYAQPAAPAEPVAGGVACECGAVNQAGAKFCAKCGKQLIVE